MGYRSDVVLVAVFANAEQHDEVMAVYRMDPNVQKHGLEAAWRRVDFNNGEVARIYEGNNVKWYESYEDVQALCRLASLLADFHEHRKFDYAWGEGRVGEDETDIVYDVTSGSTDRSYDLRHIVYDGLRLERRVYVGF